MKNEGRPRDMLTRISKNATQNASAATLRPPTPPTPLTVPSLPTLHSSYFVLYTILPFAINLFRPPPHTQPEKANNQGLPRTRDSIFFFIYLLFRGDTAEKVCLALPVRRKELSITSTFSLQKKENITRQREIVITEACHRQL